MKRKTLRFMACAAVMALTLSVTACGGGDSSASSETVQSEQDEVAEAELQEAEPEAEEVEPETQEAEPEVEELKEDAGETEEAGEADASEENMSLEDIFSDPTVKDAYASIFSFYEEMGLAISLDAIDNDFVMIFTFKDAELIPEGGSAELQAGLDDDAAVQQFKAQAAELDDLIGEAGACTVTVRYVDPDGNVLAEQSYKAD